MDWAPLLTNTVWQMAAIGRLARIGRRQVEPSGQEWRLGKGLPGLDFGVGRITCYIPRYGVPRNNNSHCFILELYAAADGDLFVDIGRM